MEHERTAEALDDLISDIRDLIDEKDLPEEPETPAEPEMPEAPELPAEELPEQPEQEEEHFQQQRWTERQRVPKHVAKLQQHQDEAYAEWLKEQEGKEPELPPELLEEEHEPDAEEILVPGKKKKHVGLIVALILALLTAIAAVVAAWIVPQQPREESELARVQGVSTILLAGTDDSLGRTDMLMLLCVDTEERAMRFVSLNRNIPVMLGREEVTLGSVYGRLGGGQEGIAGLKQAVSGCVGFVPDGCLILYPDALTEFVDVLGSVELDVPYGVRTEAVTVKEGLQRLGAQQAYALLKRCDDDVSEESRMQTQQLFMQALTAQCTDLDGLFKSPALLDRLLEHSVTDLSVRNLYWLARSAMAANEKRTAAASLPCTETEQGCVLDAEGAAQVINELCNPHVRAVTAAELGMERQEAAYTEP